MDKLTFSSLFKLKMALPLLALFAIINGLWKSGLLIIINNKTVGTPLPFFDNYDWIVYAICVSISFLFTYFFKGRMIRMTLNLSNEILLKTISKLRTANYESYLLLGEARIRTAMKDVDDLKTFPDVFVSFFNAIVMIFVTIAYMFYIYPKGAIIIVAMIVVLAFVFMSRNKVIEKNIQKKRELEDSFMRNYNDFLHGFNRVKMSTKRSDSIYFDHIIKNREKAIKLNIKSELAALANNLSGDFSFYFIMGFVLFLFPLIFNVEQTVISSFMITILFIMNPIAIFIFNMKELISYKVAMKRINEFNEITSSNISSEGSSIKPVKLNVFENLVLRNVTYSYLDKKGNMSFELQPINLEIIKGEILFIRGGNGSGKSTFMNLLSGLNIPKDGNVLYNNILINDDNRASYRDMISCVFSESYLFTENYDNFDLSTSNSKLTNLLEKMALDKVIKLDQESNKVYQRLSSGQQKRLALIYAVLEDKDIFIFDEWAAEQDPDFRKYFYEVIIPDLKSKGKTIIAITHDDAYFKFCDRLIKFNYGKMTENKLNEDLIDQIN